MKIRNVFVTGGAGYVGSVLVPQLLEMGYRVTVMELAEIVRAEVKQELGRDAPIEVTPTNDTRSYWINSDKIKDVLGFVPQFTVNEAIRDLIDAFQTGLLPDPMTDSRYSNVKKLIELGVK